MTASVRYSVRPAYHWVHTDGRTVPARGVLPYCNSTEAACWSFVTVGYDVCDRRNGTVGKGHGPFSTEASALAWIEATEAREAAYAAALAD